jgi:hypothetical protein
LFLFLGTALTKDRFDDWTERFGTKLQKTVVHLTGESTTDLKLMEKGDIIIATPEQWDMMSRRWRQRRVVQNVKLFIIDELHLLGSLIGTNHFQPTTVSSPFITTIDINVFIITLTGSLYFLIRIIIIYILSFVLFFRSND